MTDTADATVEAAAESKQQLPNKLPHLDLSANAPKFDRSRKGGYVEEGVDIYIENFFGSANQLIDQHNKIVDFLDQALAKVEAQKLELAAKAAEIDSLNDDLTEARARLADAEAEKVTAVEEAVSNARGEGDAALESFRGEANDYITRLNDSHESEVSALQVELSNLREVLANTTFADESVSEHPVYVDQVDAVDVVDETVENLETETDTHVADPEFDYADDFIQQSAELLKRARDTAAKFIEDAKNNSEQILESANAEAETIKTDALAAVENAKLEAAELERLQDENITKLEGFFESQLEAVRNHRKPYDPADVS